MIFIYDDEGRYTKKDRRAVDLDKAGRNISERICFFTKKFKDFDSNYEVCAGAFSNSSFVRESCSG